MRLNRRTFLQSLSAGAAPPALAAPAPAAPAREKLVLIGAGSAMFTQGIIVDWLRRRPAAEWEIALVDINPVILEATGKLVRRYMLSAERPARITSSVDRRDVLSGASCVVCTIGVGSRRAWEQDVFVPRKFGIFQPVGDSVMPGGVSRAMRMIPPMLAIARDVERMCPGAVFVNYSNPMTAIVRALRKHTTVPAVGLCMGTEETLDYLARLINIPRDTITARWVGLNHLTWITGVRSGGRDLWPTIRAEVAARRARGIDRASWQPASGQARVPGLLTAPFSWELYDEFGAFPAPMDRHTTEYFPERFPHGRYYGSTLGVDAYSFESTIARGDQIYERTISLAKETGPIPAAQRTSGEHEQMLELLDSIRGDHRRWYAVNVPNNGAVPALPRDAVLEIPGLATAHGIQVPPVGDIPAPIAAVLLRRLAAVEAIVEAAVTGNRKLMTEALILDGGVSDYAAAVKLTDALIQAQAEHLPQFRS